MRSETAERDRGTGSTLHVRWLGTVAYEDAWALQRGIHADRTELGEDHLLLLEHPHTYTLGRNADASHVLVDPQSVGAALIKVDRGGDVTYHGPGQLVAYPILSLSEVDSERVSDAAPIHRSSTPMSSKAYVALLEEVLIATLGSIGIVGAGRHDGYPGVWIDPNTADAAKIAQIGVRIAKSESGRRRTMHGIALNVNPDMSFFGHIVPCGIEGFGVTSIAQELASSPNTPGRAVTMRDVVDAFTSAFVEAWGPRAVERQDVVWRIGQGPGDDSDLSPFSRGEGPGVATNGANAARSQSPPVSGGKASEGTSVRLLGRLAQAGVSGGVSITDRKPDWMRAPVRIDSDVLKLKHTVRDLGLITVCEEAGCPNLSECWSDGTATFMVCGERCTRACGFCLVDTRHPEPPDPGEPARVAEAVRQMGVDFAVVTMVARDDLDDGGSVHVAETIRSIREVNPGARVEVLISDMKGDPESLATVFAERPDVMNHNVETVPRLQRAVRPSASYSRSLGVLARAAEAGLTVKSGLVVGMGETEDEINSTLLDMAAVGVSIVTIGQYLRPTSHHLPVASWWTPSDFERFKVTGESLGIGHVESSPFTRSSYHAKRSFESEHNLDSETGKAGS